MGLWDNIKDGIATGGDRQAFKVRRGQRLGRTAVQEVLRQALDGNGRLVNFGGQWEVGEYHYTVNPATDPEAPGGYYLSISWPVGGYTLQGKKREHTTVVFDANGRVANCKSNRQNGWA